MCKVTRGKKTSAKGKSRKPAAKQTILGHAVAGGQGCTMISNSNKSSISTANGTVANTNKQRGRSMGKKNKTPADTVPACSLGALRKTTEKISKRLVKDCAELNHVGNRAAGTASAQVITILIENHGPPVAGRPDNNSDKKTSDSTVNVHFMGARDMASLVSIINTACNHMPADDSEETADNMAPNSYCTFAPTHQAGVNEAKKIGTDRRFFHRRSLQDTLAQVPSPTAGSATVNLSGTNNLL